MRNNEKNILILDDEVLAVTYLKELIEEHKDTYSEFKDYTVISTSNQNDFWRLLSEYLPKIIFLDIQMPGKNGLDIAKDIQNKKLSLGYKNDIFPIFIFCTAYDQYAYNAFQVNALDYILKPANDTVILNIFNKILSQYEQQIKSLENTISINSYGIDVQIPLKEIIYFKAEMKYISIFTHKKTFLINDTLINLEEKYPKFIKIHRSYLLNPHYVQKFYKKENSWFVSLKNTDIILPVSRRQKSEIEKKINYEILFD